MTDERQGDALWPALASLPGGSGVIVRHYGLATKQRIALAAKIRRIARRRGLVMLVAGDNRLAHRARADGFHHRSARRGDPRLIRSVAVHNQRELAIAERAGADLAFVSPVFPTDTHPGGRALGRWQLAALARRASMPVIALGGMTPARAYAVRGLKLYGWAAIGVLTPAKV